MHLLLQEVLPYLRLGVQENQLVLSPPLALVATAPLLRVFCEEHAPYALAGTWWLAHTTTHCLVRCRSGGANPESNTNSCGCSIDDEAPAGVERVFSSAADDEAENGGVCWVSEDALLSAQEQRQHRRRRGTEPTATPEEPFMARNSGVTALLPPQLSSNRRLLSFVRGVPASFLGFCSLAAQHGWHHAARTLLQHLMTDGGEGRGDREEAGGGKTQKKEQRDGPARLYIVHTQLYAICGFPEGRIAHSAWWALRRTASAMGSTSLAALRGGGAVLDGHRLSYHPAVLASGASGEGLGAGQCCTHSFVAASNTEALRSYYSCQQMPSLRTALRNSASHIGHISDRNNGVRETSLVTNACSLIVSGDLTFWSGTSTVDSKALLQQHWHAFFAPIHPRRSASDGDHGGAPLSLPPPCALFLHGNVVLAVEHKLHRDAVHARDNATRSASALSPPSLQSGEDERAVLTAAQRAAHLESGDEEEEVEVADVQPLFADMGDDSEEQTEDTSSTAIDTSSSHAAAALPTMRSESSDAAAAGVPYDPQEERFLGEMAHRQAFQLLHCVDVVYLRLPLGAELVAERPLVHQPTVDKRTAILVEERREEEKGSADVWDVRWLACLFPRVEELDLEGPPSFSYASSASSAALVAPTRNAAAAVARHYRRTVRPRELALSRGAAAAAQICTTPLYTIEGLWRLPQLRRVVLRAYPFQVLPTLVAPTRAAAAAAPLMALSVMGWPHVRATGLRLLAHACTCTSAHSEPQESQAGGNEATPDTRTGEGANGRPRCVTGGCGGGAAPDFTMLSFTHVDSLAFVDALQDVFTPTSTRPDTVPRLPATSLLLHHLTQLELSKTRVTTAALTRMRLPLHTPQLQVLRLSTTPISSVAALRGLRALRVLNLSNTRVTRRGLRYVQWMPALEELFLTQCERLCEAVVADGNESSEESGGEAEGAQGGQRRVAADEEGGAVLLPNIFSLGDFAAAAARCEGAQHDLNCCCSSVPFPLLRVLDLSNNPQLTERALRHTREDGALCVEVRQHLHRHDITDASGGEESSAATGNSGGAFDGAASSWCHANPQRPPMPELDTLFLMHTAVADLACLLTLCPRLRCLDVSFTPLREEGLWAHVLCPRQLPLPVRDVANTCMHVTHFPAPLRLQQLNLSGTPLSSLHPLSEPPPRDWAYVAWGAECNVDSDTDGDAQQRFMDSSSMPELLLYPHPSILDDCRFEVQLRTQTAWTQHMRRHAHTVRRHAARDGRHGAQLPPPPHLSCSPVRVPSHTGYTIGVDAAHYVASTAMTDADASTGDFNASTQWTSFALALMDGGDTHASTGDLGGVVRYGVVHLDSLQQLRLGHSRITASGLAAGYGMPRDHAGEKGSGVGLVELSLRAAPFLCPPYSAEALRGEVPPDVAMVLHAQLREAAPQTGGQQPPLPPPEQVGVEANASATATVATSVTTQRGTSARAAAAEAAVRWTEAEALCAVLRRHRESLRLLDLSGTAVSLATFFDFVYTPAGNQHGNAEKSARPGVVASQWEDALTQGVWAEAEPALTLLLTNPWRVLDSRVLPRAALRGVHRVHYHLQAGCVLGLPELQVCDVEDTPLSTALKRIFPRLYHCQRAAQERQEEKVGGDVVASDGASAHQTHAPDDVNNSSSSRSSDSDDEATEAFDAPVLSHQRRGTVRMRAVWEGVLHKIFGERCSVRY